MSDDSWKPGIAANEAGYIRVNSATGWVQTEINKSPINSDVLTVTLFGGNQAPCVDASQVTALHAAREPFKASVLLPNDPSRNYPHHRAPEMGEGKQVRFVHPADWPSVSELLGLPKRLKIYDILVSYDARDNRCAIEVHTQPWQSIPPIAAVHALAAVKDMKVGDAYLLPEELRREIAIQQILTGTQPKAPAKADVQSVEHDGLLETRREQDRTPHH